MGKTIRNIVLLSDGTGNSRGKLFRTNVWRVYEALDLADPKDPKTPRQFAFYDDGVGSSSIKPLALLGGAVGFGLARNVGDLYRFLCRTYRHGDRIYAFGFSRGAFTIRVLVGLITSQGLVKYTGNERELVRLSRAAWRAYRYRFTPKLNYILGLRKLRDAILTSWAGLRGLDPYRRDANLSVPAIEFLGLWDTVDAYGLPFDELTRAIDTLIWPVTMRDLKLDCRVRQAVHALALDDERNAFHPRLWDESEERDPNRIRQVWFAGVHSDVGGGYPDQGLSHVSLDWVMTAASRASADPALKLRFVERVRSIQRQLSDENGPMNDSRRGLAGYYRYNPRRLEQLYAEAGMPGTLPKVHLSAFRRIQVGQDAYAPITLPRDLHVVPITDEGGGSSITGLKRMSDAGWLEPDTPALDGRQLGAYARGREQVFNLVWARRVIYFITLGATGALLGWPLLSVDDAEVCQSWCVLSPVIRGLDYLLPDVASSWTAWYANRPVYFLVPTAILCTGLWLGGQLQRSIGDAMRRVWYAIETTHPSKRENERQAAADERQQDSAPPAPPRASRACAFVQALRTHEGYQRGVTLLGQMVLPILALITVGVAMTTYGANLLFEAQASSGRICEGSGNEDPVGYLPRTHSFDIKSICSATGLRLDRGGNYLLTISNAPLGGGPAPVPESESEPDRSGSRCTYGDGGIAADLRGVPPSDVTMTMRLGTLLRRTLSEPWLLPMARIASQGADVYPLHPEPSVTRAEPLTLLQTRLVARSTGELFLHVNDAVGFPLMWDKFYENNCGTLHVRISRLTPEEPPVPTPEGLPAIVSR